MKKVDHLQKIYERNLETGNYIIEVGLDKYTDIFNDWDHSSIMKRDIDPDLSGFLESCSADIPLKYEIDIFFYIAHDSYNGDAEEKIRMKLKSYYALSLRTTERLLKEYYKKTLVYMIAAFVSLCSSIFFENFGIENIFFETLIEGLSIGGWVFLWEAISFFFFKRGDIHHKAMEYLRFTNARIFFRYESKNK